MKVLLHFLMKAGLQSHSNRWNTAGQKFHWQLEFLIHTAIMTSTINSHLISLQVLSFYSHGLLSVCLHLHCITGACQSFFSQCCCSPFSPVEPMWPQLGMMKNSSRFVHQVGAANMDQRSGSRSGLQPNLHHAAHRACSYHALDRTPSCITQLLAPQGLEAVNLVGCPRDSMPTNLRGIVGPISCSHNETSQFWYLVHRYTYMSLLPLDCMVICKSIPLPYTHEEYDTSDTYYDKKEDIEISIGKDDTSTFKEKANRVISIGETAFTWYSSSNNITSFCQQCETEGRHCGFSSQRDQAFCQHHGMHVIPIAASSVAAFLVLSSMVAATLYLFLKSRYNEEINMKVEMFLKAYGTSKPTRYTFPEVKKIARRFKDKLGQGGFGSVYKGELPNGLPAAVKMLETSTGEGEEFINEVATIGLIHHANIVRLLGFCSEGMRRALIYEFMPNESLEKYIFSHVSNISRQLLVPDKMLDISLGIARGMEYLHQGCNQRILHFDIKPHNILLDYNFNPKISDFGLAKLCARDQSIITLTAARGTMGYVAPEVYSRNFGGVSYKSDVYSFGMLVLEMVSGRRNSDPSIESQDEVYLPEWIYEQVITGQDLVFPREMTQGEEETVRKLAIVALWCIQWSPRNRPSMTKVVNMLTGNLQNLQVPPKPFVSSLSHLVQ